MRAIATETPPGDGAGVFNNVYMRVTDKVLDRGEQALCARCYLESGAVVAGPADGPAEQPA